MSKHVMAGCGGNIKSTLTLSVGKKTAPENENAVY